MTTDATAVEVAAQQIDALVLGLAVQANRKLGALAKKYDVVDLVRPLASLPTSFDEGVVEEEAGFGVGLLLDVEDAARRLELSVLLIRLAKLDARARGVDARGVGANEAPDA